MFLVVADPEPEQDFNQEKQRDGVIQNAEALLDQRGHVVGFGTNRQRRQDDDGDDDGLEYLAGFDAAQLLETGRGTYFGGHDRQQLQMIRVEPNSKGVSSDWVA